MSQLAVTGLTTGATTAVLPADLEKFAVRLSGILAVIVLLELL